MTPLPMTAANAPAWLDTPPEPVLKRMLLKVKIVPPCNVVQRHEYEGIFGSTFDAYDDAFERFPNAARVELETLPRAATPPEVRRG